jgi:hypothetical protein
VQGSASASAWDRRAEHWNSSEQPRFTNEPPKLCVHPSPAAGGSDGVGAGGGSAGGIDPPPSVDVRATAMMSAMRG